MTCFDFLGKFPLTVFDRKLPFSASVRAWALGIPWPLAVGWIARRFRRQHASAEVHRKRNEGDICCVWIRFVGHDEHLIAPGLRSALGREEVVVTVVPGARPRCPRVSRLTTVQVSTFCLRLLKCRVQREPAHGRAHTEHAP